MTATALVPRAPAMAMGSLADPKELGSVLAASGYFSDARQAAQAVVKVLAGAELGFGPIASMTGVYIVKGRVTLSANLIAAAIKRHPKYDFRVRSLDNDRCELVFLELGSEAGSSEFTMADAKKARLGGDNWTNYPRNMLFARALSNGAKWFCPDVFSGAPIYTPDELGAEVDAEGEIIEATLPVEAVTVPTRDREPSEPSSAVDTKAASADANAAGATVDMATPAAPSELQRTPDEILGRAEAAPPISRTEKIMSDDPPAPVPAAAAEPEEDANRIVTEDEVAKLVEYLDALNAPESFRTMARMAHGVADLASLSVGQAREIMNQAKSRAGSWKAATA